MPSQARVLNEPVGPWSGPGLFSGTECSVRISPGERGSGIRIKQTNRSEIVDAPAHVSNVIASLDWLALPAGIPSHVAQRVIRNTTITIGRCCAATIEHVLSAVAGIGIADARVELEGIEVPILDGSARDFARSVMRQSTSSHERTTLLRARALWPESTIRVEDESGASITAYPLKEGEQASATYSLDYGADSHIPPQQATWQGTAESYLECIAPARTFSLHHEAQAAQKIGFFKHFLPRDLLVVGSDGTPIDNVWRFTDEPARHKLLDLIGDLALLGQPLHARVEAIKSGHALTHQFCLAILTEATRQ